MPTNVLEASLSPEFERKPFERDVRAQTGAVVERIGRYDAIVWVPTDAHSLDSVRTTMDEF